MFEFLNLKNFKKKNYAFQYLKHLNREKLRKVLIRTFNNVLILF